MTTANSHATPVQALDVPIRSRPSNYPPAILAQLGPQLQGREKRALGDFFGLKNFGVNLTRLAPNSISSLCHAHSRQDEFIYIITGSPVLQTPEGDFPLQPGMCMGFSAGNGQAHCLVNPTQTDVLYLEIGDRTEGDEATYPLHDLQAHSQNGHWAFFHKDGSAY
jgi:uncharacterized cupin superfamily protein